MAVRELPAPPGLAPLYGRAAVAPLRGLPGIRSLPLVGRGRTSELPDLELRVDGWVADRPAVDLYARVCGFGRRDELPPTFPHVPAFGLALALMLEDSFPLSAPGMVHVSNRIEQKRALGAAEPLDLRVRAEALRPHSRGRQFDMVTRALVQAEEVWIERSTYLSLGGGSGEREERASEAPLPTAARWAVPGDTGRRYARVSGDVNPIHMHPLSARLLGFPGAIAHGMWLKARCLAALEGRLPGAFAVEVDFRKPVVLPARVAFGAADGGRRFELRSRDGGRLHLLGSVDA